MKGGGLCLRVGWEGLAGASVPVFMYLVQQDGEHSGDSQGGAVGKRSANGQAIGKVVGRVGRQVEVSGHLHGRRSRHGVLLLLVLVTLLWRRSCSVRVPVAALDATHNL